MATLCREICSSSFLHLCYPTSSVYLNFATFPGKASPWPEWDEFRDIFDKLYPEHMEHEGPQCWSFTQCRGKNLLYHSGHSCEGTDIQPDARFCASSVAHTSRPSSARPPRCLKKLTRAHSKWEMNESSLPCLILFGSPRSYIIQHPVSTENPDNPAFAKIILAAYGHGVASTVMLSSACLVSASPEACGNAAAPLTRIR